MARNTHLNVAYDLFKTKDKDRVVKPYIVSKSTNKSKFKKVNFIIGSMVIFLLAVLLISSQVTLYELNNEHSLYSKNIDELKSEYTRLSVEFETRSSFENVEEVAKNELGLQKMDKSQVEYVATPQSNKIESSSKNENIFDRITNFFENMIRKINNSLNS